MNIEEEIKNKYINPKTGLKSIKQFQDENPQYDKNKIKEVIENTSSNQIYKKPKPIYAKITSPPYYWQCDLMFFEPSNLYKNKNNGYAILLVMIENNSRFVIIKPIKNKTKESIHTSLEDIISKLQNKIKNISFDNGSEFNNKLVKQLLTDNNITFQYYDKTQDRNNMMMVERIIRTIREKIEKYMIEHNTKRYIDDLDNLVYNYNNTKHSQTKSKPFDLFFDEKKLDNIHKEDIESNIDLLKKLAEFQNGDIVRIKRKTKNFNKGQTFSKTTHKVIGQEGYRILLDNDKKYTINELIKVNNEDISDEELKKSIKTKKINTKLRKEGLY